MDRQFDDKYYDYLDNLRESGITNMFGARSYLQEAFEELGEDKKLAGDILSDWMVTFGKDE
jgi:hypothetical protein